MPDERKELVLAGEMMTPEDMRARINAIQKLMIAVMKPKVHYYKLKNAKDDDKPALSKAGAEVILLAFGLHLTDVEVTDLSTEDERRYRVLTRIRNGDGMVIGAGIGECSTAETKYAWRQVANYEEWKATPEDKRRVKWYGKGDGATKVQQVATDPADNANTCLKMAKKRSMVDATLTSTAASDCFEQDLDEDDHPGRQSRGAKPNGRNAEPQAAEHNDTIKSAETKPVRGGGEIWIIASGDGTVFRTFDSRIGKTAAELAGTGEVVTIRWTKDKYGNKALAIEGQMPPPAGDEPPPPTDEDAPKTGRRKAKDKPADAPKESAKTKDEPEAAPSLAESYEEDKASTSQPKNGNDQPAPSEDFSPLDKLKAVRKELGLNWDEVRECAQAAGTKSTSSKKWSDEECEAVTAEMFAYAKTKVEQPADSEPGADG